MSTRDERDRARVNLVGALITGLHRELAALIQARVKDDGNDIAARVLDRMVDTILCRVSATPEEILGLDVATMGVLMRGMGMVELNCNAHLDMVLERVRAEAGDPAEAAQLVSDLQLYAEGIGSDRREADEGVPPELPEEPVTPSTMDIIVEHVRVEALTDGSGWIHTHGMATLGLPELEMRNVPLFLVGGATRILNIIAAYMYDGKNGQPGTRAVKAGETLRVGNITVGVDVATPLPGNEEHYVTERWLVTDAPMRGVCALCEAGDEAHKHDTSN